MRATLAEAEPRFRKLAILFVLAGAAAIGIELATHLGDERDPWALLGIPSVVSGCLGAVLFGIAFTLQGASQFAAGGKGRLVQTRIEVLHRAVMASPVLFAAAAIFSGLAGGILLVRGLLHAPVLLVPAAVYVWFGVLAVRQVRCTSRFLYRQARTQAAAAERAVAEAARAQLAILQAQVHPHFLFNALNTVASLVRSDPIVAERTVENLAEVLRRTLDRSRRTFGTLAEEVDHLEAYLAVEKERRGQRLTVHWQVEEDCLARSLPVLTLQPLVENALKHGLSERLEGGILTIGATTENGLLHLFVSDDGPGFPPRFEEGTGLSNLRRRLRTLYGEEASIEIDDQARGARVDVTLPVFAAPGVRAPTGPAAARRGADGGAPCES